MYMYIEALIVEQILNVTVVGQRVKFVCDTLNFCFYGWVLCHVRKTLPIYLNINPKCDSQY